MLGLHAHARGVVWNDPYWFGRCVDCNDPMIRRQGASWSALPHGYQVVWRAAAPDLTAIPADEIIERITILAPRPAEAGKTADA